MFGFFAFWVHKWSWTSSQDLWNPDTQTYLAAYASKLQKETFPGINSAAGKTRVCGKGYPTISHMKGCNSVVDLALNQAAKPWFHI